MRISTQQARVQPTLLPALQQEAGLLFQLGARFWPEKDQGEHPAPSRASATTL